MGACFTVSGLLSVSHMLSPSLCETGTITVLRNERTKAESVEVTCPGLAYHVGEAEMLTGQSDPRTHLLSHDAELHTLTVIRSMGVIVGQLFPRPQHLVMKRPWRFPQRVVLRNWWSTHYTQSASHSTKWANLTLHTCQLQAGPKTTPVNEVNAF